MAIADFYTEVIIISLGCVALLGVEGCAQFIFYSFSAKQVSEQYGVNPGITKISQF